MQDVTLLSLQGPMAKVYVTETTFQGDGVSGRAISIEDPYAALLLDSTPLRRSLLCM